MGRFFLALGGVMLVLLIVDSAMNDPDVQPFVDRQLHRAGGALRSVMHWFGADAEAAGAHPRQIPATSPVRPAPSTDSPTQRWYWSTMLAVAAAAVWLLKMAVAVTLRNGSATAAAGQVPQAGLARRRP